MERSTNMCVLLSTGQCVFHGSFKGFGHFATFLRSIVSGKHVFQSDFVFIESSAQVFTLRQATAEIRDCVGHAFARILGRLNEILV